MGAFRLFSYQKLINLKGGGEGTTEVANEGREGAQEKRPIDKSCSAGSVQVQSDICSNSFTNISNIQQPRK